MSKKHKLQKEWEKAGIKHVRQETYDMAEEILKEIKTWYLSTPEMRALAYGGILMEWENKDQYLSLSFISRMKGITCSFAEHHTSRHMDTFYLTWQGLPFPAVLMIRQFCEGWK